MSSYISPAPQGDPKATGAYAVAIAETPGSTNMAGHPTDSAGNVQVDRVWGNMPLQPDDERAGGSDGFGGGSGDNGWSQTYLYNSETLYTNPMHNNASVQNLFDIIPATAPDSHTIATTGYSNFPQYIPNYAGDGDTGLEVVVPNFVRLTLSAADDLATANKLNLYTFAHTLTVNYVESTDTTVRVYAYDTSYGDWSNASNAALIGLRAGDQLNLSVNDSEEDPITFANPVTVTNVNNDGDNSWFEFTTAEAMNLDTNASGTVYAGPNLINVVTVQRPNQTAPGAIVDEYRNINVRYFGD